ncbi:unnamed protein product [Symbiodinium necroappetens]|uniref:Uncharacterized protein n=1 Tax=Symbiodinium necroappetens TaxID=1628268 RepID=A0A812WFZ5_9DINO|nr:unnamed protein product [Symbiodinium necroappetens]
MGVARKRFCQAALEVCFGQLEEITPVVDESRKVCLNEFGLGALYPVSEKRYRLWKIRVDSPSQSFQAFRPNSTWMYSVWLLPMSDFSDRLRRPAAARCGLGNAGPVAGFLDLTLQGLREQWQEAECQVGPEIRAELSPLRSAGAGTRTHHHLGNDLRGVRYRKQLLEADRCGSGSPIDLQEDRRLQLLTQNRSRIPCWYNRLEDQTQDARDEEATEAFCAAANTSTCSFQKTSQARYTLRLEAEPCTPQPVKGGAQKSQFLWALWCLET